MSSIDYAALGSTVTSLMADFGTPITVSRAGTTLFTTSAVFTEVKTVQDQSSNTSKITRLNNAQAVATIGPVKTPPLPGDQVSGKGRLFKVIEVEAVKPALTVVAYKLKVQ